MHAGIHINTLITRCKLLPLRRQRTIFHRTPCALLIITMTTTTTNTGLKYIDTTLGQGATATAGQHVTVHYTGWLYENETQGKKFDSSRDRNEPFIFSLGAGMVIKGWDEGVQGMKVGGQRTLIIPANLGYGARGAGGVIPPNATLKFDVELIAVS